MLSDLTELQDLCQRLKQENQRLKTQQQQLSKSIEQGILVPIPRKPKSPARGFKTKAALPKVIKSPSFKELARTLNLTRIKLISFGEQP